MTADTMALDNVKEYYGKVLSTSADLQTSACCTDEGMPTWQKKILSRIDDEIMARFYGCGSPLPLALEGCTVLDLGSGSGRDVYALSALVGESGRVIGVDMTDEQIAVARRHVDSQMKTFGFSQPNVEFHQGYIEDLAALGIADNSVDAVVSNCVVNLSPAKSQVFAEIFRVLKPGGELYFSDVFSGRRIPPDLVSHPVLHGECLSGALYIEDFRRMLRDCGCLDYRLATKRRLTVEEGELADLIGMVDFYSMTVRAFKLESLEDICEDYGQSAVYHGTIEHAPHFFDLDDHHRFETGKPMLVCGNTAAMVSETRYGKHFTVTGNRDTHFGPFDCSPALVDLAPAGDPAPSGNGACC